MTTVNELQARMGKVELTGTIVKKDESRSFDKFGKAGRVANARVKDATGEVTLTLWNEQCDQVAVGDTVIVHNGWVSEYRGELQLGTGKFGSLEVKKGDGAPIVTPTASAPAAPAHTPAPSMKPQHVAKPAHSDNEDGIMKEETVDDDFSDEEF